MRFNGVILEPDLMASVLTNLDRISSDFFLIMSPTHWQFRLRTNYVGEDRVYIHFTVSSMFSHYVICSRADNLIPLVGKLSNLCRALRSARGAHETRICLDTKDGQNLLCFQISKDRGQPCLYQKIPIQIEPRSSIHEGDEPVFEAPQVRIRMPNLKVLSRVVDRMKKIDDNLIIRANTNGEAIFSVRNDMAHIRTKYRDLKFQSRNRTPQGSEPVSATCKVAAKSFSRMLSCCSLDASVVVGCIAEDHWFVVYLELGDRMATITYYIPLIVDDC